MKTLYNIYESLLDDEDTLMVNADNAAISKLLGDLEQDWIVGNDNKTLLYNPSYFGSRSNGFAELYLNGVREVAYVKTPKTLKDAGLVFQPIAYMYAAIPGSEDGLKYLQTSYTAQLTIDFKKGSNSLNLSKLPFEVKDGIQFNYAWGSDPHSIDITSYPKHLSYVWYMSYGDFDCNPHAIKNWNCDILVVQGKNLRRPDYVGIGEDYDRELVQQIISNNPKVKEFYFCQDYHGYIWVKASLKGTGAKRTVNKFIPRNKKTVTDKIFNATDGVRDVLSWWFQHEDLWKGKLRYI